MVVDVPAAKQRVVLATLGMRPNRVVSFDELADAVWGESAPATARATLRNYVKRLRHGLGAEMAARIQTRDPGYRIDLGEAEVDIAQFTRLYAAGGAAIQSGGWEQGGSLLGQALDLWRGAPLSDVPSEALRRSEVPRLEQMRLQAMDWRLEAQLQLGRHEEAVPQLRALITQFPLREGLHASLMLALYRCGRQADALTAYQDVRRMLVDELGVEPGQELQQLHQRILLGDGRLLPPAAPVPGNRAPTPVPKSPAGDTPVAADRAALRERVAEPTVIRTPPRQLPPAPRYFAGRAAELRQLTETLGHLAGATGTVVVAAIGGTAGVGKTALALHWAHRVAPLFPDGQLYADLHGFDPGQAPLSTADVIRGFLCALGVPHDAVPANPAAQMGLYRSLLADRGVLIVLDDARDAEQVRPLLPSSPRCLTVVTSRGQLTGLVATDGASLVPLDVLPEDEAGELLERRLGPQRVAAEPGAVTDLIRLCARLPLALSIAAAHAAANPGLSLTRLAGELGCARLDTLATQDAGTDIRAAFSRSYQYLTPAAARLFRLLGVHPGPDITAAAAASLAGVAPGDARAALAELAGAHLLAQCGPGRFACHDLLRAYAAERAEADEDCAGRRAAVHRILDHYLHSAHAADRMLDPHWEPAPLNAPTAGVTAETITSLHAAQAWFQDELRVLRSATALAARVRFGSYAWQLAWAQATYLKRHGGWHAWASVLRVTLAAAEQAGDLAGQARGHIELGRSFGAQGDLDMALEHAGKALILARAAANRALWAEALNDIACYDAIRGRYEAPLAYPAPA